MHEIFILHIKTSDSKWVRFRPPGRLGFASDKPDVVEGGERAGRCRCKAFPGRWWVGVAN